MAVQFGLEGGHPYGWFGWSEINLFLLLFKFKSVAHDLISAIYIFLCNLKIITL